LTTPVFKREVAKMVPNRIIRMCIAYLLIKKYEYLSYLIFGQKSRKNDQ
jgi:hypothetical protein